MNELSYCRATAGFLTRSPVSGVYCEDCLLLPLKLASKSFLTVPLIRQVMCHQNNRSMISPEGSSIYGYSHTPRSILKWMDLEFLTCACLGVLRRPEAESARSGRGVGNVLTG